MKTVPLLLASLMSFGCADTYYSVGQTTDEQGRSRAVAVKRFQKYSKTVGPGRIAINGDTIVHEWFDPSPNSPRQVVTMTDPKTGIVTVSETPIVASSDPSASTFAAGEAMNRAMHGISNIAGTIFAGWAGVEAAKGLTTLGVTQSNNAASVSNTTTKAGTKSAGIAARQAVATEKIGAATIIKTAAPVVP